ncbi:sensor histidine kinase [Listeria booriae]|uniref:hypothetical protein n=1 Tax=Listeria booriae TaxID=1552123 RepID=UPI00164E0F2F|nr:hypothetical protein [Listeria booriae]MBC6301104.1 hypothetical protein [Listeria booriae]
MIEFIGIAVSQLLLLVLSVNIMTRNILTKLELVAVSIILSVFGTILLAHIQYFSLLFVLGLLTILLKIKKVSCFMAIAAPVLGQLVMIMSDYIIKIENNFFFIVCLAGLMILSSFALKSVLPKIENDYFILALLILTTIIFYMFIYAGSLYNFPKAITSIYTLIFATFILAIALTFIIITKISQKQLEIQKQQLELAQLEEYTTRMESLYASMNMFRHDYINILASLQGYIAQGDKTILENYFKETIAPLKNTFEAAEGEE